MPLLLDLLRHGEAAAAGPQGDHERPLTRRGEQAIRKLSERLAHEHWRPLQAFTSPLRRARETAAIVVRAGAVPIAAEELDALRPDREPESVLEELSARGVRDGHVLLVGHQPLLGRLAQVLTGVEYPLPAGHLLRIECAGLGVGACRALSTLSPESET